jgi:hypothetical protein
MRHGAPRGRCTSCRPSALFPAMPLVDGGAIPWSPEEGGSGAARRQALMSGLGQGDVIPVRRVDSPARMTEGRLRSPQPMGQRPVAARRQPAVSPRCGPCALAGRVRDVVPMPRDPHGTGRACAMALWCAAEGDSQDCFTGAPAGVRGAAVCRPVRCCGYLCLFHNGAVRRGERTPTFDVMSSACSGWPCSPRGSHGRPRAAGVAALRTLGAVPRLGAVPPLPGTPAFAIPFALVGNGFPGVGRFRLAVRGLSWRLAAIKKMARVNILEGAAGPLRPEIPPRTRPCRVLVTPA